MTRLVRFLLLLYLGTYGGLIYVAGDVVQEGAVVTGCALCASAVVVLIAFGREIMRAAADQAAAVRMGRPRPHTFPSDLNALLRAELSNNCTCALWWNTFGTFHDRSCPRTTDNTRRHEEN